MNDDQLLRYSRHILLNEIAYEGQEKLSNSHALIIGSGGLGAPVSLYLAAAGVGQLTICDFDEVELTNLQRQVIHSTESIGINKSLSAKHTIAALNPEVNVHSVEKKSSESELSTLIKQADVVIDCSDNFETRYLLNKLCVRLTRPLVSGAAIGFEGQITVYDQRLNGSPCYHCLFPSTDDVGRENNDLRCAEHGVFAPLVGMIGTTQAAEAIKLLIGIGQSLQGRLLMLDTLAMQWHEVKFKRDPNCEVCAH